MSVESTIPWSMQGIIVSTEKEIQVSKTLEGAKVDVCVVQ